MTMWAATLCTATGGQYVLDLTGRTVKGQRAAAATGSLTSQEVRTKQTRCALRTN